MAVAILEIRFVMDWSFGVYRMDRYLSCLEERFLWEFVMNAKAIANTVTIDGALRFHLLDEAITLALSDLSNPKKTIQLSLLKGLAAGELQLINAHHPPEGIHHNLVPARFTVDLGMEWKTSFELHLMVRLVDNGGGGDNFVLGHVNHDQWHHLSSELPSYTESISFQERWVGVKYSPIRRDGYVFLSKNLYNLLLKTGLE